MKAYVGTTLGAVISVQNPKTVLLLFDHESGLHRVCPKV